MIDNTHERGNRVRFRRAGLFGSGPSGGGGNAGPTIGMQVLGSAGTTYVVPFVVLASDGTPYTVTNAVLNSAGASFSVI